MGQDQNKDKLGAGFRFSTYGPTYDPGPAYWESVARRMTYRFPGSKPEAVWIVSNFDAGKTHLTFPAKPVSPLIVPDVDDRNEAALTLFDKAGMQIWLQVESGDAPIDELIRIVLDRYGNHPCVVGMGVDVEWYHSTGKAIGQAVTDDEARNWLELIRKYNPEYRMFLKHWMVEMMPPTVREGLLFVDDSQKFESLEQLMEDFTGWGQFFAPYPVAYQFGYPNDHIWWGEFSDPATTIGKAILTQIPNTTGLFWVDFTALDVFKP